jgi:lipopolysaccharide/colanic/teichoic acid biosynthesis glycosyltransferase
MSYLTNNVLYSAPNPVRLSAKRIFDVVCCLIALPILALCTLVIAICMQLVSPGPVFFRQERVGLQGRRFRIYKFRTMTVAADTGVHQQYVSQLMGSNAPMIKMDARGDSRLIFGGWLIRACGLDELPQLINVLRGDMSLVGPRPCLPAEYEQYTPMQRKRFGATPGLTGLWQVSGKNRTTFHEMIRLDIEYAEKQSLWLDLAIIAKTIPALVQQIMDTRQCRKHAAEVSSRMTEIPFPTMERMTEIPFPMERVTDKAK